MSKKEIFKNSMKINGINIVSKPDRIYETLKHIEITAADYNKGVKYCLIKYPYKDIKPARDGLSSCKIRYVLGQPIRNCIRAIRLWIIRKTGR